MGKPVAPTYDQDGFRARTNVKDPAGVNAAFDAGDAAKDADWTQDVDELIRVRLVVKQTNAAAANHDDLITEFILQYNNGGAGWNNVGAVGADVEDVQFIAATGFADGDDTTQVIGAGTFVTGDSIEVDSPSDSVTFTAETLTETEIEVAIEIVGANVADEDTIQLRLLYSAGDESPPATAMGTTKIPTMTANKAAGYELVADSGSFSLAGTVAALLVGFALVAASGPYALAGTAASLQYGRQFPVEAGSYAFTGTAVTFQKGRTLEAVAGTYSVAGTAATFDRTYELAAGIGAYTYAGSAASLERGYPLTAAAGAYTLSGSAASLERGYKVPALSGSYALAGTAASLEYGREVAANAGVYSLAGTAASLEYGRNLAASSGSYSFTGSDATLVYAAGGAAYTLDALSGTFSLAGTAASLEYGRKITAAAGSYALTGTAVTFDRTYEIAAVSGTYALSGTAAGLLVGREVSASSGSYALTGTAAGLERGLNLPAASGAYNLSGTDAALLIGYEIAAVSGSYSFSGSAAALIADRAWRPRSGVWTVAHQLYRWTYSNALATLLGYTMPDATNHCRIDTPLQQYGGDPLGIPDGATIKGILVECDATGSKEELGDGGPYAHYGRIQLRDGDAEVGGYKVIDTNMPPSYKDNALGGSTDKWGYAWTPAKINSADFGARIWSYAPGIPAPPWVNILIIDSIGFTICYSPITVVSPNGGEEWRVEESQPITWLGTSETGSTVEINLFKGGVKVATIASGITASDESYAWSIPVTVAQGTDYKIRVKDEETGDYDDSNSDFTILAPFTGFRRASMAFEGRGAKIETEGRIAVMEPEQREATIIPEDRMASMETENRQATLGDE